MARLGRRRNYTSVATTNNQDDAGGDDGNSNDEFQDEPDNSTTGGVVAVVPDEKSTSSDNEEEKEKEVETTEVEKEKDEITTLTVTILDSSHKKFVIPCNSNWTIGKFKLKSSLIHQVPPKQQRLIYHGKMLTNDTQTLLENKINSSDIIIHLFPKPRVVVTSNNSKVDSGGDNTNTGGGGGSDNNNGDDDDGPSGAHIPSIIINQEEQDRRGQILVLGSVEIAESQNNVKMLSLLLVMICSMRLLALFSIAMGAGTSTIIDGDGSSASGDGNETFHNHTNDIPHNNIYDNDFLDNNDNDNTSYDYNDQVRPWENSDYYDLVVSGCGFYVGMLGLKATQENTLQLATMYAIGTIISGILWNIWNIFEYIHFFEKQTEYRNDYDDNNHNYNDDNNDNNKNGSSTGHNSNNSNNGSYNKNSQDYPNDELPPLSRDDFVTVAFFTILMPLSVWILCCIRAFEFRRLISEAEEEATERIRNEYNNTETTEQTTGTDNENNSITEMV
jgi:hypothetical protein